MLHNKANPASNLAITWISPIKNIKIKYPELKKYNETEPNKLFVFTS